MLNIAHVIACYPPHAGGMERNTEHNARNIAARGHKVVVLTSDTGFKPSTVKVSDNLTVHYLKCFEFAHTPIIPSLFFRLLSIPKNSVVHLHIAQAFIPELTFLVCKIRHIPYLTHIHLDVDATGPWGFLLPFYKRFVMGPILRNADAVTVLTKDYKNLVINKYKVNKNKIEIIPNGIYYTPGKKLKTRVSSPVKILFLGRLSVQKNIPLMLNSISRCIYKYHIPLKLTLIGEGEKKKDTIDLITKLKIGNYVEMFESNDPKLNQEYFRNSDMFIMSSVSEAFGTTITEAMASGTPVVATNILSVRNLIKSGKNGLLVKSDPDDMAKAIKTLVDDNELYKNIVLNGIESCKKYKWEKVIDKYEKLYRKLAKSVNR